MSGRKSVEQLSAAVVLPEEAVPFIKWGQKDLLSCRQVAILLTIRATPGVSTGPVAKALGLSKPAVTRAVDKLAKMRLVKRAMDPSDLRMVQLLPVASKKGGR